jgi:hypothetical protein
MSQENVEIMRRHHAALNRSDLAAILDARAARSASISQELELNFIAQHVLGLPSQRRARADAEGAGGGREKCPGGVSVPVRRVRRPLGMTVGAG